MQTVVTETATPRPTNIIVIAAEANTSPAAITPAIVQMDAIVKALTIFYSGLSPSSRYLESEVGFAAGIARPAIS